MYLVGLHIYYELIHGPCNTKLDLFVGMMNRIAMDMARAITPHNLLGINLVGFVYITHKFIN